MAENAGTISSNTKISLKDVAFIVGLAIWLGNIQSSVNELSLKIDGRLNLYDFRITAIEKDKPGVSMAGPQMAATASREVKKLSDLENE